MKINKLILNKIKSKLIKNNNKNVMGIVNNNNNKI